MIRHHDNDVQVDSMSIFGKADIKDSFPKLGWEIVQRV